MSDVLEKDLRAWLRNVWSNGKTCAALNWIEPASGSSIGFPDVLIPVWPVLIPCELKIAKRSAKNKYFSLVRPVQCRFHLMMKAHDFFSCFLVAYGERNCFDVYVSHNSFAFADHNETPGELLLATKQSASKTMPKTEFIDALKSLLKAHKQFVSEYVN
jgi:hypothetical protein